MATEFLELADWRRRMAALFVAWRVAAETDPMTATLSLREAKDALFRDHPQSPLRTEARGAFRGLDYWPYDPRFRMQVRLEPEEAGGGSHGPHDESDSGTTPLALPSSGPDAISFRRIGRVRLRGALEGHALSVFWIDAYGGGLFLPFRDATSGSETYGAGRYALDTIKAADHGGDPQAGTLTIDFNMAFHPSCAYDPRWSCPLAPPENTLTVPVHAGERLMAPPG